MTRQARSQSGSVIHYKNTLKAADGKAWALGWNDVCLGLPWREVRQDGLNYEIGRLSATEARAAGVSLLPWDGQAFTRWHPNVRRCMGRAYARGVPMDYIPPGIEQPTNAT